MKKIFSMIFIMIMVYFWNSRRNRYTNTIIKRNGAYYFNQHIIVNQDYKISPFYIPFPKYKAQKALRLMINDAYKQGFQLILISGFRSYFKQMRLFIIYANRDGLKKAKSYSAMPGFSEHQTGLAFDVATPGLDESIKEQFQYTKESKWLRTHAHKYGFIIRYPKGKEHITKFMYEPWHLRYVGKEDAQQIKDKNITLEEYFYLV
ncbi:M15 family metallopeptidase [Staphylococcus nepalensis]|uniref:M15 family metallopeptidase n=1 Tax=Staphylococcus nepalensis TaxID=214473 RepID=UPI001A992AC1|nr:M15 family metallopeptidase [Staphylococcus nepalensis]MBO1217520.1 M15 family metallopeptidase [Staphylococcus nepalensis]MBO1237222.1 M15 family metallopeptidase [Staphylococcus nepalensis]